MHSNPPAHALSITHSVASNDSVSDNKGPDQTACIPGDRFSHDAAQFIGQKILIFLLCLTETLLMGYLLVGSGVRRFIAKSLSLSSFHRLDMTKIMLEGTKNMK